jgi:hypothetical protein
MEKVNCVFEDHYTSTLKSDGEAVESAWASQNPSLPCRQMVAGRRHALLKTKVCITLPFLLISLTFLE